jgi:predicted nucleotidyltransferase
MPVRSLSSSVLKWPDADTVHRAARDWALRVLSSHPELQALGILGSYARGDWGVGSDLDLIAVVSDSSVPFERRSLEWDLSPLPVPAEILVYTRQEWERLRERGARIVRAVEKDAIWLYGSPSVGT